MEIREICDDDFLWLLNFENEEEQRANSLSKEQIKIDEHHNWYTKYKEREDIKEFVLIVDGERVGAVAVKKEEGRNYIDVGISNKFFRRGFAKEGLKKLFEIYEGKELYAKILPENVASIGLFEGLGFKQIEDNKEYLVFKKNSNS